MLQNLFQSGNIEKIFAHYDKNSTGTLSSAEQDAFLDDLQQVYGIDLPAKFRQQAKTDQAMTPQQFEQQYDKMTKEFQKLQQAQAQNEQREELKRELAGMTPQQQKELAKIYGIKLPGESKAKSSHAQTQNAHSKKAHTQKELAKIYGIKLP